MNRESPTGQPQTSSKRYPVWIERSVLLLVIITWLMTRERLMAPFSDSWVRIIIMLAYGLALLACAEIIGRIIQSQHHN